jgi:tuberous sclerosis protein 2
VPLIDPKTAPSAFMRNLATLLCRDVAFTPLKPPLTEILMSIAEHLTDVDTAALPTLMSQQQALSPTNPEWIANWRNLLNMSALHAPSRPLTRQAIFDQLESLYSVLLDLPEYRVHLGGLVFEFIKAQADRKNADIDDTAWRIFSDEVVNRSMDIEHGPILYDDEGEVLVNQINLEVDNMLAFLQELACEGGEENAQTPLMTPSPTMSASTPPAIHPSIASRRPSEYPRLHMSLDAAASLATSTNPTPRLPDMPSEQTFLSPPKKPLAVSATATLVTSFGALVFTPRSLREHNLVVAVRIFRILLSTSLIASDQRSRLCALQFLIRMRADREHRLHFAQDVTTDNYVHSLAAQISRDRAAVPSDSILSFFRGDERRPRSTAEGDTSKEAPRFGRRGVKQSKLEPPSRSRSRAPPSLPRAAPLSLNAIWFFPDRPPFHLSQDQAFSERLTSYDPAGPGRKVVLPLSDYLDTITQILDGESDWEILSFVLCHLPSQLANKHLMCGPKCRTSIIKMFDAICTGIHSNTFASSINWPAQVYPSDATGLAYNSMIIFISYQVYLEPPRQHVLVETLYRGLSGPPAAQQCCLHGLTLCAYEMPVSMTKYLVQILDRLSQIMSSPSMPVNIMNFLHIVGNRPQLYANFTQEQYKKVFAVSLRYLQDFNKHSLAPGQSWAIAQHVRIMSYATLYIWFLSMDLADRPAHIPDITRGLLEANEGNAEVDEPTEVCFDWLARYTYSSADPRPARSALDEIVARATAKKPQGRDSGLAISDKTWLMGNSVVITIRTLPKLGWVEVLIRRPCGLTKFLCRLNNLPMVGPGEVDPDLLSVPGMLVMDKNVDEVPTEVFAPPPTEDEGKVSGICCLKLFGCLTITQGQDSEGVAAEPPVPHPVTGYVWSGTAPSQRRKDVAIDPSFFALQLSAYPQGKRSFRGSLVTNQTALARFLRTFDNRPVIDTHKVGVLYVGPGQTNEEVILANAHGSPSYTRFLANLGRLINLHGQNDVYTGELEPGLDGDYAYAWWDDIGQIVYHVATLMPTIAPDAPDADQRRHRKKMHIGNDFVRIVWNDSGVPYAFDTLRTQVQFVNVVVEPHSAGTIGAFSADRHEHEYFRVSVQRAAGMPRFSPLGDYKLVSARSLPALVRQISLHADWFANTFQATGADTRKEDVVTNWRERLRAIRRFADLMSKEAAAVPEPEVEEGILGEQSIRDFTIKY